MIIRTIFSLLIIFCFGSLQVLAQTASLLPNGKQTFLDANGKPLTSGKVYFYIPSTTTPKTTWQDANEAVANANPVVLDSAGRAIIYGSGSYRQIVKDKAGNTIWDANTSSTGTGSTPTPSTGDGDLVGTVKPWAGLIAPNQYLFAYGQEISRTTYDTLFTAITLSASVTCTSGSPTLTNLADTTSIPVGANIEVACLSPGVTVISKTTTTITISSNAISSSTATAVIFPWGNGNGSSTFNLPDLRGRVVAGRDNMGGTDASRLTSTYFGETAGALGANGGSQSQTLATKNLPAYTPSGTVVITDPGHQHQVGYVATAVPGSGAGEVVNFPGGTGNRTTSSVTTGITAALTGAAQGGTSTAFATIQPTITINYIIKVTPDTNSSEATGVLSIAGMTGVITCGAGLTCTGNIINTVVSSGSVTSVSVVSANGFTGTVTNPTTTAAITLTTSITGILSGNGTAISAASITGSGSVVLATSPTIASPVLTTPNIGVATATSINGNIITTGTGTLTIAASKTLKADNTLTFAGTDGSTLNVGTGGTLGTNAYTSTAYAPIASPTFTGTVTIPTPFTLGAISITSTGTQLNYLNAATGTTGTTSTNIVFSTSPTITSPSIASPTITGSFTATGLVTNAALANPATTVNGQTCTLGSTCTVTAAASSIIVGTTTVTSGSATALLYNNAGTLGNVTTANNGVLITSAGGVPSISSTIPNATQDNITRVGTVVSGTWQSTVIGLTYGGTGANLSATGGARQVLKQVSSGATITVGTLAASDLDTTTANTLIGTNGSGVIGTINMDTANTGLKITSSTLDWDVSALPLNSGPTGSTRIPCETAGVMQYCTATGIAGSSTAGVASLGGQTGAFTLGTSDFATSTAGGLQVGATPFLRASATVNAQTGATYAIDDTDRGKLITFSRTTAVAVSIAAPSSTTFANGWFARLININTGAVTLTIGGGQLVNGLATLTLFPGQMVTLHSDGTNYQTTRGHSSVSSAAFGTLCDGTTDDFTAMQNFFTYIGTDIGTGVYAFPGVKGIIEGINGGTQCYMGNNTLEWYGNMNVEGATLNTSLIFARTGANNLILPKNVLSQNTYRMQVKNLIIDNGYGEFVGNISGTTLTVDSISAGTKIIVGHTVFHVTGTPAVPVTTTRTVSSQTSGTTGGAGVYVISGSATVGASSNMISYNAGTYGIRLDNANQIVLENVQVRNIGTGLYLAPGVAPLAAYYNRFQNVTIQRAGVAGIDFGNGANGNTCSQCRIEYSTIGIRDDGNNNGVVQTQFENNVTAISATTNSAYFSVTDGRFDSNTTAVLTAGSANNFAINSGTFISSNGTVLNDGANGVITPYRATYRLSTTIDLANITANTTLQTSVTTAPLNKCVNTSEVTVVSKDTPNNIIYSGIPATSGIYINAANVGTSDINPGSGSFIMTCRIPW